MESASETFIGSIVTYFDRFKHILLGLAFALVFFLGTIGWLQTDPRLGFLNAAYASLGLFVVAADPTIGPSILLNVCRFLAPALAAYTIVVFAFRILISQRVLSRALRARGRTLVIGSGPIALETASRFHNPKEGYVMFLNYELAEESLRIRKKGIIQLGAVDDATFRKLVQRAKRVIVSFKTDSETATGMKRVREAHVGGAPIVYAVFNNADLASSWATRKHERIISVPNHLATSTIGAVSPQPVQAIAPAPLVIGEGATAAALLRRLAIAWQQPGERMVLHAAGSDRTWADKALAGLESRVDLHWHEMQSHPVAAVRVVHQVIEQWVRPDRAERFVIVGPSVYILHSDDSQSVPLATAIAREVPSTRVACLVEDARMWWDPKTGGQLTYLSSKELISEPRALCRTREQEVITELIRDAQDWPEYERPSLDTLSIVAGFGTTALERDVARRRCAAAVTDRLEFVFAAVDIKLEWARGDEAEIYVLAPDQLDALAHSLSQTLGITVGSADTEVRIALLEFASRLPTAIARTGGRLVARDARPGLFGAEEVLKLGKRAHEAYKKAAEQNNATGSGNVYREWEALSEVERRSNLAQAVDIPLKLAIAGLAMHRKDAPREYKCAEGAQSTLEILAIHEHRRWAQFQVRNGQGLHPENVPWGKLNEGTREYDRVAVRNIAPSLAALGFELVELDQGGKESRTMQESRSKAVHPDGDEFKRTGVAWAWPLKNATEWQTPQGDLLTGDVGDWWVVTEDGALRIVKPEAFEASYDHVSAQVYRRTGTIRARRVTTPEVVETTEGPATAFEGDWIATDPTGNRWPIKHDRFSALYYL